MSADPILEQGLWYQREWGWKVFITTRDKSPVKLCGKCPPHGVDGHDGDECSCLLCHGFYAATDDPDRLAAMRRQLPNGNLAARCGSRERGGSGIAVLDVDSKPGVVDGHESLARLERAIGLLPDTLLSISGSGGLHFIYDTPAYYLKSNSNALASDLPGLDIKADGGAITLPPSIHARTGEEYFWCRTGSKVAPRAPWPEILTKLATAAPPRKPPRPRSTLDDDKASRYAARALEGIADQIRAVHVGGGLHGVVRDGSLRVGTFVGAGLLDLSDAEDTLMGAAADAGDTNPSKTRNTILSGLRKGAEQPYGATA